ncbi:MAG: DUF1830 domain-containing protein [Vulcanococcus sp.]
MTQLSCGYRNSSDRMVIVRCIGPEEFFLERVIFPFELLSFLAPPESIVEIWTHGLGGPELMESFGIRDLLVESEEGEGHLSLATPASEACPSGQLVDFDWQQAV